MNNCAVIYARVSTSGQSTERQVSELQEVASNAGWNVVSVFTDDGISGTKGRDKRPALDAALKKLAVREADRLMVWSVDRLGRSLQDLISTLNEIHSSGAELFIKQQALDTATPAGKALFGMLGVFAEFESAMIKERIHSGLAKARAKGVKLGRPERRIPKVTVRKMYQLKADGLSLRRISRELELPYSVVRDRLMDTA
jgi:DNA invertase Pin-like site-specific DNA recombinase